MSLGGFFIGLVMMAAGFLMVWKTQIFIQLFGDLGVAFGAVGAPWMSWKLFGVVLLLLGFLIGFGLFETMFSATLGRLFFVGLQ